MRNVIILAFLLLPGMAISVHGQKKLLALSKGDHVLAIIDPLTGKTLGRVPVSNDPHEVIASSDGKTAYVSITYSGTTHEIDVIDLVGMKRLPDIDTRPLYNPHGLDFAAGKLWFSAEGSRAVGRYDPAEKILDWSMGTGEERTHMVFVTRDAKYVYTTNVNAGTVTILEYDARQQRQAWLNTVVPVSKGVEGFDVTPNGKELWAAAAAEGEVWIVDLASKKTLGKADVVARGANRLKFSPDGKYALVSSLTSGELFIIDAATRKLVKTIKVGKGCAGILADPDSKKVYVACTPDNYIQVVDLGTMEIVGKIELNGADGMAWGK